MRKYLIAFATALAAVVAVSQTSLAAGSGRMNDGSEKTCGDFGFGTVKDCE